MAIVGTFFTFTCVIALLVAPTTQQTGGLSVPTRDVGDYPLTRRYPDGCTPSECEVFIGIATNAENDSYLDFYMEANAQIWVAAGFSASQSMFSADVVVCTLDTTTNMVTAQDTYNPPESARNNIVDTVQNVMLLQGNFNNGRITCIVAKTIIGVDVPDQDINLNTNGLYMLYARGDTGTPQQISAHASGPQNRAATAEQINPAQEAARPVSTTTGRMMETTTGRMMETTTGRMMETTTASAAGVHTTGMSLSILIAVFLSCISVFLKL